MGGPPGPNALYQQNNLIQQIVQLEWDQELREIVQGNNASIEQIIAEVQRIKQAMGQIIGGINNTFGQVRTDAQNQHQGIVTIHQQLVDAQRRIGLLETEANRLQNAEIGALKEKCKKIEHEQLKSGQKLPQFNEQLDRIPKFERELQASNERIALLERKLLEKDQSPSNASQPMMEKVALIEKRLKDAGLATDQSGQSELVREIQRLQLWVQSLNGGWSSDITPDKWTNPLPELERRCERLQIQQENLESEFRRVQSDRTQSTQIQSDRTQSSRVQFDRTQSNQFQSNQTQLDHHQSKGNQSNSNPKDSNLFGSNPMSSNPMELDQISFNFDGPNSMPSNPVPTNTADSSQMPSNGLSAARLNPGSDSMPSSGLSAARLNPGSASTSPFDQLDPLRTQSDQGLSPQDQGSKSGQMTDTASVVRQINNLNKYVTMLEGKLVTRIEVCENDVNMASSQAIELATQFNEVSQNLSKVIQQVHNLRAEWNDWNENDDETQQYDHENPEEIFHDPAEQSTMLVPAENPVIQRSDLQDRVFRSLIDLSPIQPQRDIPTPPTGGGVLSTPSRAQEGFPSTVLTMAALKGTRRLYVQDQSGFRIGRIVIIHDLFAAQVVAYGSIVIDRPVDRDYPVGSTVRELTSQDDHRVDSQGRTVINGVVMDPGDFGSNTLSLENHVGLGRQIPPVPEDGLLINLEHESKLHAWLLQGMTKTGRGHWKDCADYYRQYKPTATEVSAKEDHIKYDQYTRAINHIGGIPDMQGRLLMVIHQVRLFEQNLLRVMKGLSRACEFYAKLLLNGIYEFLERLRTLQTATEQVAQTFAEKQAEEEFHPQLEAHLITWISAKLPDPVKTRAHNRRPQPSVRILLTEFYFTLLPHPSEQARHLGNLVKNPTSASSNPVEVITNIEQWRVSVQLYKESTGQMPIQEDIKTAFEKLVNPILKNCHIGSIWAHNLSRVNGVMRYVILSQLKLLLILLLLCPLPEANNHDLVTCYLVVVATCYLGEIP